MYNALNNRKITFPWSPKNILNLKLQEKLNKLQENNNRLLKKLNIEKNI